MKLMLYLYLLCSQIVFASFGETVGAGSSTIGLGSQFTNENNAENNYYNPSSLAWNKNNLYSLNYSFFQTQFKKINSITVSTDINSGEASKIGSINPNTNSYQKMSAIHFVSPFIKAFKSQVGITILTPGDKIAEASTGDAYRPEYVMYDTRLSRTSFNINYIQPINNQFSFSLGFLTGVKAYGETYFVARNPTNDPNLPSSGKVAFNAKPTSAMTFSLSYLLDTNSTLGFSFSDEIKSDFESEAKGISFIGAANLGFDWDMMSLLYYDPRIYRLHHAQKLSSLTLITSIEYHDWSNFEAPTLKLTSNSGTFKSSRTNKNYSVKSVYIPKIGVNYKFSDAHAMSLGYQYKESPLELKNNSSGNTIDLDSQILSSNYRYSLNWDNNIFNIELFAQYHLFKNQDVSKKGNKENGLAGDKIGYPGYKVGGNAYTFGLGINWII